MIALFLVCAASGWFYILVIAFVFPYAWAAAWLSDQIALSPLFFSLAISESVFYGYLIGMASTPGKFWKRLLIILVTHTLAVMVIGALFDLSRKNGNY